MDVVDMEIARQALSDHQNDIMQPLCSRLGHLLCLVNPPDEESYVGVHFEDAEIWLIYILGYNWLTHPDVFNLDRVENEVLAFFLAWFVCISLFSRYMDVTIVIDGLV